MCRKLIYLSAFVLFLSLVPTGLVERVEAADATLVGWWKLDDGAGPTARDSSGNANHGTINGGPLWDTGKIRGALHFNGSTNYVQIPFSESLRVFNRGDFTLCLWVNTDEIDKKQIILQQGDSNGLGRSWLTIGDGNNDNAIRSYVGGAWTSSGIIVEAHKWYHAAVVVTEGGAADIIQMYVNGEPAGNPRQDGMEDCEGLFLLGCGKGIDTFMDGLVDDVRIYSRGLTQQEIQQVMIGIDPTLASEPSPADQATDVTREVVLNWKQGVFADQHDVYFGTSVADVTAATHLDPMGPDQTYRARQDAESYAVGERLNFGQTYYWRVDEVNAPPTGNVVFKGDVWSFTVEPVAYPVENMTATASSKNRADEGAENTVNGSGLDDDDLHSSESATMWLSSITDPGPGWIQYEFARVHKLSQMLVWNYNSSVEPIVGFGVKEAAIEYSVDGTNWTTLGTTHEFAQSPGAAGYGHNTIVDLSGAAAKYVKITANSNWGGMVHQFGLSEVRFLYLSVQAREPHPSSGATGLALDATLSFRAGREAARHDIYLSTDEQAVVDGTAPVNTVAENRYGPLALDLAQTYYWRVDEVNEAETPTTWQGDIWSFLTQKFAVVDNFEDYNEFEPFAVYNTWTDGYEDPTNGSIIGYVVGNPQETSVVHSGSQSVPLFYDNTAGATYSEVTRTIDNPGDWTKSGVKALTLWFYGDPNNPVTEQMYVKVNGSKVLYDGDAENISRRPWQTWYINLVDFGVDLTNVTELSIGLERSGFVGGKGVIYLDDIMLSPYDRQFVTPTEPSTANLLAHWPLDEGSGTTVTDVTGNGHDGTFQGDPEWVAGELGGALRFDGFDDYVIHTLPAARTFDSFTVALWVRADMLGQAQYMSPFSSYTPNNLGFQIDVDGTYPGNYRTTPGIGIHGPVTLEWVHLAVVGDGTTVHYYYNGVWVTSGTIAADNLLFNEFIIGASRSRANCFSGAIDDFRVYDLALTPDEIAWLGGRTTPFDKPF